MIPVVVKSAVEVVRFGDLLSGDLFRSCIHDAVWIKAHAGGAGSTHIGVRLSGGASWVIEDDCKVVRLSVNRIVVEV